MLLFLLQVRELQLFHEDLIRQTWSVWIQTTRWARLQTNPVFMTVVCAR